MEETKAILDQATPHSLVIFDELGRGTSTYDGQAIATSVLDYLVNKVNCRMLFSTHYHGIQNKYLPTTISSPDTNATEQEECNNVEVNRMGYNFNSETDQLIYMYKLEKGPCPASFGIQVARIAGLPDSVVQ